MFAKPYLQKYKGKAPGTPVRNVERNKALRFISMEILTSQLIRKLGSAIVNQNADIIIHQNNSILIIPS